jgi:hypothetical protein
MAHDPRILSFYVGQLQTRQRRLAGCPELNNYGEMFLACLAIVLAVSGFFWVYDEVVHRDPLSIPAIMASAGLNRTHSPRLTTRQATGQVNGQVPGQATRQVLAPNMDSPAVALASEDVPDTLRPTAVTAKAEPASVKKPKRHAAKRISHSATQAFAAEPGFFRQPFRGF